MKKFLTLLSLLFLLNAFMSCLEILNTTEEEDPILSMSSDVLSSRSATSLIGKIITLKAVNGKFVSADNVGNILIANKTAAGNLEKFQVVDAGNGLVGFKCIGNNKYVSAEDAGNDSLVADRGRIGSWEKFLLDEAGDKLGFIAMINNKFVCAENKGSFPLIANRVSRRSWETFTVIAGAGGPITTYTKITSPANESTFQESDTITVQAEAQDPDGVNVLRLWIDNTYHSVSVSKPYMFTVTGLSAGEHSFMVRAIDNLGNTTDSEIIYINVDGSSVNTITQVGTTSIWDNDGNLTINKPSGVQGGDLLVLFLHRTDDDLPLRVSGWTKVAECLKQDNGYQCSTESSCVTWESNASFCKTFNDGGSHDLGQVVYYKKAGSSEPSSYTFNLNMDSTGHPGWAILTALRGAATVNPIRDWSHKGCDGDPDSIFPSVYGKEGDLVLLSQAFDDRIEQLKFLPPSGANLFEYTVGSDETGFLFGKILTSTGETGTMRTGGDGGPNCKDALISLTIKPQ